jgi:hypothetical protein
MVNTLMNINKNCINFNIDECEKEIIVKEIKEISNYV